MLRLYIVYTNLEFALVAACRTHGSAIFAGSTGAEGGFPSSPNQPCEPDYDATPGASG